MQVPVFRVSGETVYLTADNRQGLVVVVSAKRYQSYVTVGKAFCMLRKEPRRNEPRFFCSACDTC